MVSGLRKRCKEVEEPEEEFLDFEDDSADDYQPSESSESEDDVDVKDKTAMEDESDDESEDETKIAKHRAKPVVQTLPVRRTRFSARQQQNLIFESDKYFGYTNRKARAHFALKFKF